jgi:hypothetical protein
MKAQAPEVQSNTALAARLEDGVSADIWFEDFNGTEHALNAQIEDAQSAMIEAATLLRGEPAKAQEIEDEQPDNPIENLIAFGPENSVPDCGCNLPFSMRDFHKALADRLENATREDIWYDYEEFRDAGYAVRVEGAKQAMHEAAAILRGEPAKAPGSVDTSVCPKCGSFEIEGEAVEIENSYADQSVSCVVCDASWIDTYTATSREILDHGTGAKE